MSKIRPLPVIDDYEFDGIDEVQNVEYHLHRGTKSKKRIKKKQTRRLDGTKSPPKDIVDFVKNLVVGRRSIYIGSPFLVLSLFLTMLLQLSPKMQRYNTLIILTVAASVEFKMFPMKSVRAQLIIALTTLLSVAVDIFQLVNETCTALIITTIVSVIFFKALLLNAFLRNTHGAVRTRKYLDRRFRLFIIPLYEPRRIMRDVRGRIIAIGWMHLVAALLYFTLFMVLLLYLDYSAFYLDPTSTFSLPTFLAFKTLTSLILLVGVLYDTDIRLCLWHFGCLGCWIDYIRKYIRRKRIELHGFPLMFSFSNARFLILSLLKILDFLWGMYGWTLVGYAFGAKFKSLNTNLQILYGLVSFALVVFDLWVLFLLLGVRWLLRRRKIIQQIGQQPESDDSEIEEFGLRLDLQQGIERQKDKAALIEIQRQLYYQRMKKEEVRFAENAYSNGKRSTTAAVAAADWLQHHVPWAPKTTSAVHPVSDNIDLEAGGWDEAEFEQLERTQTHPLIKQLQSNAHQFNNAAQGSNKYEVFWEQAEEKDDDVADNGLAAGGGVPSRQITRDLREQLFNTGSNATIAPPVASLRKAPIVSRSSSRKIVPSTLPLAASPSMLPSPQSESTPAVVADLQSTLAMLESETSSDEDVVIRSPLRRKAVSQRNSRTAPSLGAAAVRLIIPTATVPPAALAPLNRVVRGGTEISLSQGLTLSPEQFAGIWEEMADSAVGSMSTVLVSGPVLDLSGSKQSSEQNRSAQQVLLSTVVAHVRGQGFNMTSAGLYPQCVVKLLFYGTAAHSSLPENPVLRMGLLEVKLFPGAVVPTSEGDRQSYLIEMACRCRNDRLGSVFLALLSFGTIFKIVD